MDNKISPEVREAIKEANSHLFGTSKYETIDRMLNKAEEILNRPPKPPKQIEDKMLQNAIEGLVCLIEHLKKENK